MNYLECENPCFLCADASRTHAVVLSGVRTPPCRFYRSFYTEGCAGEDVGRGLVRTAAALLAVLDDLLGTLFHAFQLFFGELCEVKHISYCWI